MKNILVISSVPILKAQGGNRKCIKDYCDLLKNQGNNVFFLLITDHNTNKNDIKLSREYFGDSKFIQYKSSLITEVKHAFIIRWRRYFCKNHYRVDDFCHTDLIRFVKKTTKKQDFDIVIVNYVYYSKLLDFCNAEKKVLFTHDVYLLNQVRQGTSIYELSPNDESKGLRRADVILAIQNNEKNLFHYLAPDKECLCVFSPFTYIKQQLTKNNSILFFSGYNLYNIAGIEWFIKSVFPIILAVKNDAKLIIGGSICSKISKELLSDNIILAGYFQNPSDFYSLGDIVINPVFHGSGLKIKTFEAIAHGKTCIIHPHSIEGAFNIRQLPVLSASRENDFASLVLEALSSVDMREEYAKKTFDYIKTMNEYIQNQYKTLTNSHTKRENFNYDVSVIIVNYNTRELLKNCLKSLYEHTKDVSFEVFVSDNGSKDGSLEMLRENFPQVKIIDNNANLGFGAANNRALEKATGKYVFYLNSDTVLLNNAVKIFFDYWEQNDANGSLGAIGANLLDEKNQVIHSAGHFRSIDKEIKDALADMTRSYKLIIPFLRHKKLGKTPPAVEKKIGLVDYVTGADLFVKNDEAAYFDEKYFLYYEESDMQKKMAIAGKERRLIEGPLIQHLKGGSDTTRSPLKFYRGVSKINSLLSSCIFQHTFYKHPVKLFLLKLIITAHWLNPALIGKTGKYLGKLWRA
ncbi:glycosyltransferase [Treponema zioleckii]|uniref:glycosyltransferase n=1 Tax=Treponema zioleckii TaxID=331680 RepID=UPI00168A425F|nr:glycosyltransferase [Treponema zioleckii]